jgi:hypothetical protein
MPVHERGYPAAMLTADDVRLIAVEEGLGEHADVLADWVIPGWRLDPGGAGRSRIGGDPDLAADETWPLNQRGVPMTFLAQIATDELPALEWPSVSLPAGVLVRVFADLIDNPFEPGPARVFVTAAPAAHTPGPGIPDPWPEGGEWDDLDEDRVAELPEAAVRPVPFLSVPETHPDVAPDGGFLPSEQGERYYTWANRLRIDGTVYKDDAYEGPMPWAINHFLGAASSGNGDVQSAGAHLFRHPSLAASLGYEPDDALADPAAWTTLLSLHDGGDLEILDGGSYAVLVPVADLRAGTLHRAYCAVDSC